MLDRLSAEIRSTGSEYSASRLIPFAVVSRLPYLWVVLSLSFESWASTNTLNKSQSHAVIQETLRIHPNTGTILERRVPPQGTEIDGYYVPGDTIVGVNAWVLQFDKKIYGEDVHRFQPERWLDASEDEKLEMNRNLFAVSNPAILTTFRRRDMISSGFVLVNAQTDPEYLSSARVHTAVLGKMWQSS